jgi:hypothetical protein
MHQKIQTTKIRIIMKTKAIFTSIFIATMLLAASPADAQIGEGHGTAEKGTCDH